MSNLFTGNQPKSTQDDKKDSAAGRTPLFPRKEDGPGGASLLSRGGGADTGANLGAAPRAPLFPKRDDARPPLFSSRTAADQRDGQAPAPLFPRRDDKSAPLFPPRDGAPASPASAAPKAPLFPPRAPAGEAPKAPTAPLFGARPGEAKAPQAPQATQTPLFGARAGEIKAAQTPQAPLFGARPAEAPKPLFGAKPASAEPVKPLFAAKPAAPAPAAKPLFGANPVAPVRAVFNTTPPTSGSAPSFSSGSDRDAKVTDEEFILLRDFLYQQAGIFIAENRKYLVENRLASRLRDLGLRNFGEYYNYLRFDNNRAKELNVFYENMTTNETSFFRNGPQLDVFRDKVLMKVIDEARAKGQKKLRIWSAGCSSGEEPYTLAMILYEVLRQEIASWDIKITANDLSLAVLSAARRGIYNDYAIRTTPPEMLDRYFTKEGNLYRIDSKLSRLISFGQINLNDKAQLAKVERSQIVFCRNVIIYFDDDMKRSVINAFYDNLLPGGYLLIGHSESLHNLSRAFKPESHAGSIVYCKQN